MALSQSVSGFEGGSFNGWSSGIPAPGPSFARSGGYGARVHPSAAAQGATMVPERPISFSSNDVFAAYAEYYMNIRSLPPAGMQSIGGLRQNGIIIKTDSTGAWQIVVSGLGTVSGGTALPLNKWLRVIIKHWAFNGGASAPVTPATTQQDYFGKYVQPPTPPYGQRATVEIDDVDTDPHAPVSYGYLGINGANLGMTGYNTGLLIGCISPDTGTYDIWYDDCIWLVADNADVYNVTKWLTATVDPSLGIKHKLNSAGSLFTQNKVQGYYVIAQGSNDGFTPAGAFGNVDEIPMNTGGFNDHVDSAVLNAATTYTKTPLLTGLTTEGQSFRANAEAASGSHALFWGGVEYLRALTPSTGTDDGLTPYVSIIYDTPLSKTLFDAMEIGVKNKVNTVNVALKNLFVEALIPANAPPIVDAGPDQSVQMPVLVQFAGTVTDVDVTTKVWTFISGPVTITPATQFSSASIVNPTWAPVVSGVYVFKLTADDGSLTGEDTVQITVAEAPEVEIAGDGRITHPLTWVELTDRQDAMTPFAEVDLNDPTWYFGGYKAPWILLFSAISRGLSDRLGQPEHMSFGATLSDVTRFFRALLADPATRYITNRPLTMRMIDDEDRRLQRQPTIVAVGYVADYSPRAGLQFQITGTDWLKKRFSRKVKSALAWQPLITLTDFPNATATYTKSDASATQLTLEAEGKAIPIIYGEVSDLVLETIVTTVPGSGTNALPFNGSIDQTAGAGMNATTSIPGTFLKGERIHAIVTTVKGGQESFHSHYFGNTNEGYPDGSGTNGSFGISWNRVDSADGYRVYAFPSYAGAFDPANPINTVPGKILFIFHDNNPATFDGLYGFHYGVIISGWTDPDWTDFFVGTPPTTTTTIVDRGHGQVPPVYVGQKVISGTNYHQFVVAVHPLKSIDEIYIDGAPLGLRTDPTGVAGVGAEWLIPGYAGWNAAMGTQKYELINGRRFTTVYGKVGFGNPDSAAGLLDIAGHTDGAILTLNVKGIETIGDGTGTLLTTPAQQALHFLNNFLAPETAWKAGVYFTAADTTFAHLPNVPLVDPATFSAADVAAASRIAGGYESAGIIGANDDKVSALDALARFNVSGDFDSYFNRKGQYCVSMEPIESPSNLTTITDVISIKHQSFSIEDLVSQEFFNILPFQSTQDYSGRTKNGWVEINEVRSQISIDLYDQERESSAYFLYFLRNNTTQGAATIVDVMARKLNRFRDPRRKATFVVPFSGLRYEPGSVYPVTHIEGVGADGWIDHQVRFIRQEVNPTDGNVHLDAYDLGTLFDTMGFWSPDAVPTRDLQTDEEKRLYMSWAPEEPESFYSDGAPVKTWN